MLTPPNPSSGLPAYLQLAEQVKHAFETGAMRPGEPLPGIGPLAVELVISPNTVTRAYRQLQRDGVVDLLDETGAFVRGSDRLPLNTLTGEHVRLAASVGSEASRRKKRDRELEAAQEVQQRLLPREFPVFAGLDYAGFCRPASGVGGDYFDFIRLSDTEMAIAIGDVCGKGIPAALLMAMLRGYLRGQTVGCLTRPVQVMETLNRLVCESFSANRYATFFYAHYDAPGRTLRYVNAGHNPPLIFRTRSGTCEVLRLDRGGPVIGLAPESAFVDGCVTFETGDLMVAFTDGITEAMNAAGDEWGEERLAQVIAANRRRSARDLVEQITHGADEFTAGASQYDDMTLVTIRIT
jgi:sigma-B regulation protein RsbU (phosphoserine phosphatase)